MKHSLPIVDVIEQIASLLKLAGFELRNASMKTESCYYALPGRRELIRVSAHPKKKSTLGLLNIVTKLTVHGRHCDHAGEIWINLDKIPGLAAGAIGRYMIACGRNDLKAKQAAQESTP